VSPDAPARGRYFVLLELPLGVVVVELPLDDGAVVLDGDVVLEGDVLLELDDRVEEPGDADGAPVSLRLQASVIPPTSARAQRPDSIFFIADVPPFVGCVRPATEGCNGYARGTMRARVREIAKEIAA